MAENYSEALFQSIDTIVSERVRHLPYDRTIVATITNNDDAQSGKYEVTTDNNTSFYAYSSSPNYNIKEKVYVRIPDGDYTKQKVIVDKYIAEYDSSIIARNLQYYMDTSIDPKVWKNLTSSNNSITLTLDNNYIVGFSGLGIILHLSQSSITATIKISGYNTINIAGTGLAQTYMDELFTNDEMVGFSLGNINPKTLTIESTDIAAIQAITVSYGYWLATDDLSTMTVFLYNKRADEMIYYDPDTSNELIYNLAAKLLKISGNTATPETPALIFYGAYDDADLLNGLEYVQALHSEYKDITIVNDDTFEGQLRFTPSRQLNKTVVCQAYAITTDNKKSVSNRYSLYGRAELGKNSHIFELELVDVPVFAYDNNKKLLNPEQANVDYICRVGYLNRITNDTITPAYTLNGLIASGIVTNCRYEQGVIKFRVKNSYTTGSITGKITVNLTYANHSYSISINIPYSYMTIKQDGFQLDTTGLLVQVEPNNQVLFQLTPTSLTLGGYALTNDAGWGGTAANAISLASAPVLSATNNQIKITIGDKDSSLFTVPYATTTSQLDTDAGSLSVPVYITSGAPAEITSLNETLLGFDSATSGFSPTGQSTKLYTWLKAIQTNMNTLASKHSGTTLSWPATL